MIHLTYTPTRRADFGGFQFFLRRGERFDAADYAEAYDIDLAAIDADQVRAIDAAVDALAGDELLEISHDSPHRGLLAAADE